MTETEAFLADFDFERAGVRACLERLPEAKLAWRPHAKSRSLGELAQHLGGLPAWTANIVESQGYDLVRDARPSSVAPIATVEGLLTHFETNASAARARIVALPEAALGETWSLTRDGVVLRAVPRLAALRVFFLHHWVHHRGQLSVYLRLLDVPLPHLYGTTADG